MMSVLACRLTPRLFRSFVCSLRTLRTDIRAARRARLLSRPQKTPKSLRRAHHVTNCQKNYHHSHNSIRFKLCDSQSIFFFVVPLFFLPQTCVYTFFQLTKKKHVCYGSISVFLLFFVKKSCRHCFFLFFCRKKEEKRDVISEPQHRVCGVVIGNNNYKEQCQCRIISIVILGENGLASAWCMILKILVSTHSFVESAEQVCGVVIVVIIRPTNQRMTSTIALIISGKKKETWMQRMNNTSHPQYNSDVPVPASGQGRKSGDFFFSQRDHPSTTSSRLQISVMAPLAVASAIKGDTGREREKPKKKREGERTLVINQSIKRTNTPIYVSLCINFLAIYAQPAVRQWCMFKKSFFFLVMRIPEKMVQIL